MLNICKQRQLPRLLGAAALLLASSTAQALEQESPASKMFRQTVNTVIAAPSLVIDKTLQTVLYGNTSWHREKFFELVENSGYELKQADTTAGLIPEIKLVYEQSRELSEGDREALAEEIAEFAEEDPTWIEGKLEARILRFLLSVSEVGDYRIGGFEISVLPIPGFRFTSMPNEITYTPDTILLMRRMNEIQEKMQEQMSSNGSKKH
ncbi:MAG: hypothetical protein EBY21_00660 [Alphaproteobacteria bacterium]|nr:hypothetical protein [Alphaproteobacteria bacterium]